jgi:RNA polymerase sigma-70 factor (ECF subfamily)
MRDAEFEKIVEEYYEDIYKLVFLLTKNRDDAEDITQETFLKVKRYLKSFEGRSSVKTWLYRIATNEAKRFFKKRETEKHIKIPEARDSNFESERYERLKSALKRIDKESYEILYLKFFKNMKEKEIAFILNIPEGTVKSRLHKAKEKLRKEMQDG